MNNTRKTTKLTLLKFVIHHLKMINLSELNSVCDVKRIGCEVIIDSFNTHNIMLKDH